MDIKIFVQCVALMALTLVADSHGKRSKKSKKLLEEKDILKWRCSCDILAPDAKLLHSFPDMTLPNDLAWQGFTLRDQCKDIRHFCRNQCAKKLDFHTKLAGRQALGYEMCEALGDATRAGGIEVFAQATLDADDNCHHKKPIKSVPAKTRLCCGHTTIPVNDKTILAFGWNPDCNADTFILSGEE